MVQFCNANGRPIHVEEEIDFIGYVCKFGWFWEIHIIIDVDFSVIDQFDELKAFGLC
jgi:hypothetical protein